MAPPSCKSYNLTSPNTSLTQAEKGYLEAWGRVESESCVHDWKPDHFLGLPGLWSGLGYPNSAIPTSQMGVSNYFEILARDVWQGDVSYFLIRIRAHSLSCLTLNVHVVISVSCPDEHWSTLPASFGKSLVLRHVSYMLSLC